MPKSDNQKQKLLYIADFLRIYTDESHSVRAPQIISYLGEKGIRAERKSIYNDIQTLIDYGYDIVREEGARGGYRLVHREFELAEVKLLVDLVQASKFITTKKSRELTSKLEHFVSSYNAAALHRQIVVTDRSKSINESIYYNVDLIYEAIAENAQIKFHYFEWDIHKEMKLRKEGNYYIVSPWLLLWDDENYYLIAYDSAASIMKHYRVDKMLHIQSTEISREGKEIFDQLDQSSYTRKTFGMFAGEEHTLQLLCANELSGVIVDRFGTDVSMRPYDEKRILVRVNVAVSHQFYGWLSGFSDRMEILSPADIRSDYRDYLENMLSLYRNSSPDEP